MNARLSIISGIILASAALVGCVSDLQRSTTPGRAEPWPRRPISLLYTLQPAGALSLFTAMDSEPSPTHPAGGTSTSAVELRIVPAGAGEIRAIATVAFGGTRQSAYELILPAAELDLIVGGLERSQFVDGGPRPGGQARIEIGYGDKTIGKEWTPEPRLDDLTERTIRHGRRIPLDQRPLAGTATVTANER